MHHDDGADNMGDDAGDDADSQWLTYKELAKARGITPRSAVRLAQRHKWRRQTGNDGTARVLVPASDAAPATPAAPVARDGARGDAARDTARAITALEEALFTLRQQLERERARADAAEAMVAALAAPVRLSWAGRIIRALRLGRSRRPAARSTPESGPQR